MVWHDDSDDETNSNVWAFSIPYSWEFTTEPEPYVPPPPFDLAIYNEDISTSSSFIFQWDEIQINAEVHNTAPAIPEENA